METAAVDLLAQLPASTIYLNPFKLLALVVAFAVWALFAAWVDKDSVAVNTYRILWNLITLMVGAGALLIGLFVPIFWVAWPAMVVANGVVMIVYVVHRNKRVRPVDTVMTMHHFRRIQEEGLFGKKKKKQVEVQEKVAIKGADGKRVAIPEADEERIQFKLVQDLAFDALWRRASIVEIVPSKEEAKVIYQVDGLPVEREPLTRPDADALVLFMKRIAGLNLEERRKPQRGEIQVTIGENKHRFRIRTDGSTVGEKLALHILYREDQLKVPDLGFNPKQLEAVMALREVTPGMIVLSAPPKQGLTTSIYSFTRTHDRFLQNVQLIEFEKELEVDNVTQHVFSPTEGKTFTETLLKIVRADPDIIVLPELRDRESAAVAAQAATQKQKVYVGLSAADVFDALRKWITLVGDKALVAKGLLAVGNQRLVRVLCDSCKEAYKPDAATMRKLNLPADKPLYRVPEPQYDKHGNPILCQACQGVGYMGRIGVFDWLTVDDGLREVMRRAANLADLQSYLQKKGAAGLQAQALEKVLAGVTSIQEVARVMRGEGGGAGGAVGKAAARPAPKPAPRSGPPRPAPKPAPRPASENPGS